ncbi:MAG: DegT/DnrJ/EryC1/StrS aminotransferase, partial [Candidatus Gottesmanbacteria bacterium GW2011_GWA1_47_8]
MISASLSPNTEPDDVWLAIQTLFSPWKWQNGEALLRVRQWFGGEITLFSSGRVSLFAILKSFEIGTGDEVIIQAFTCVAVPNSVLWSGATPVYVDIDDTCNIDPQNVEKKITNKTKAIIIQHTFGIPADLVELAKIAKKHGLLIIEDFAHSLGLHISGDAAFFSFGRDKVISSVWGGGAVINSKYQMANDKL